MFHEMPNALGDEKNIRVQYCNDARVGRYNISNSLRGIICVCRQQ